MSLYLEVFAVPLPSGAEVTVKVVRNQPGRHRPVRLATYPDVTRRHLELVAVLHGGADRDRWVPWIRDRFEEYLTAGPQASGWSTSPDGTWWLYGVDEPTPAERFPGQL